MSEPSLIETAVDVTLAALVAATADAFGPVRNSPAPEQEKPNG